LPQSLDGHRRPPTRVRVFTHMFAVCDVGLVYKPS
jgi:hypothetical protein